MSYGTPRDDGYHLPQDRPVRRGPNFIIILVLALIAFWFLRGRAPNPVQQVPPPRDQADALPTPRERGDLDDWSIEEVKSTPTPSYDVAEPSESASDRTTQGDWTIEEVGSTSKSLAEPVNKKTTEGDWSIEEVDGDG